MEKNILKHIPNWTRFVQKYQPDTDFTEAFESRIESISELDTFESIAKYINVELGVLLLREHEIDHEMLTHLLDAFSKKEEL